MKWPISSGAGWQKDVGQKNENALGYALEGCSPKQPISAYFFALHVFGAPGEAWLILLAERS
jgi:hypothetical protein